MRLRVSVVVALGRDAERLEGGVLVGGRHGLVAGLVSAVHRFANRDDCMFAAILGGDEIKLHGERDVEQRTALTVLPLHYLACCHAGQDAKTVFGKKGRKRPVHLVNATELIAL